MAAQDIINRVWEKLTSKTNCVAQIRTKIITCGFLEITKTIFRGLCMKRALKRIISCCPQQSKIVLLFQPLLRRNDRSWLAFMGNKNFVRRLFIHKPIVKDSYCQVLPSAGVEQLQSVRHLMYYYCSCVLVLRWFCDDKNKMSK